MFAPLLPTSICSFLFWNHFVPWFLLELSSNFRLQILLCTPVLFNFSCTVPNLHYSTLILFYSAVMRPKIVPFRPPGHCINSPCYVIHLPLLVQKYPALTQKQRTFRLAWFLLRDLRPNWGGQEWPFNCCNHSLLVCFFGCKYPVSWLAWSGWGCIR
jgi:hypothetical protein